MDTTPRSPNGFLSSLGADDFELIRPHLKSVDLVQDFVLVAVGDTLKRAYLPHRGVISLVVDLARGEHVQIAMIGRHSIFGVFSALGDPVALNSAIVMVPGPASTIEIDRLRALADKSATLRAALIRHGLAVFRRSMEIGLRVYLLGGNPRRLQRLELPRLTLAKQPPLPLLGGRRRGETAGRRPTGGASAAGIRDQPRGPREPQPEHPAANRGTHQPARSR